MSGHREGRAPGRPKGKRRDTALAELRDAYSGYEPAYGAPMEGETSTDYLVHQVTAALRDTVAGVDHLKVARRILADIARDENHERSQAMAARFQEASAAVSAAVQASSALLNRQDLTDLFARKRFLVTRESAKHGYKVVEKAEKWLKVIVREIGGDLVTARREAIRVSLVDSLH